MSFGRALRLSHRHFSFQYPDAMTAFEDFLNLKLHPNPLAGDFGIYNQAALDEFMMSELPRFDLVLLSERYVWRGFFSIVYLCVASEI